MLDHLSINSVHFAAATAFYDAVLPILGYSRQLEFPGVIGYGREGMPSFWIADHPEMGANREIHVAFMAPDADAVQRFYSAAIGAGADGLHEPRVWPEYHPAYFGAFVRDPDGNNVEAVTHTYGNDALTRPAAR